MVFSSFAFLFRFLPVFLIVYYLAPARFRNAILFIGSLIFYAVGEPEYVPLLFLCVLVNYGLALWMDRAVRRRKGLLFVSLLYNFGLLFYFKYSGFSVRLPLGISFYTFQISAYVIDVYRGRIPAEHSFVRLGAYLTMFPQLVAGPIVNYGEIRGQLGERVLSAEAFEDGLKTLILGLGAKVILADRIGILWNTIQTIGFSSISTPLAWLGAYAYSMELYFDFAGYSMMAIGLGTMLGFTLPVNFKQPYISTSVTEFWRRWHITLGRWFRDYVYIPLGGNRRGTWRTVRNLFLVWALTALWHGAGENYLIWGASLLFLLALEKMGLLRVFAKRPWLGHVYVLFFVPLTWVFFAITDIGKLGIYLTRLFPFVAGKAAVGAYAGCLPYLREYGLLLALGILFCTPYPTAFYMVVRKKWAGSIAVMVILALSVYYLAVSVNNPFLYFNF